MSTNASEFRDQGNQAFKQGQFQEAIDRYTEALTALHDLQLSDNTKNEMTKCYSNRAQCYINLDQYDDAIDDATRGKRLDSRKKSRFKSMRFSIGIYTIRSEIFVSTSQCI